LLGFAFSEGLPVEKAIIEKNIKGITVFCFLL